MIHFNQFQFDGIFLYTRFAYDRVRPVGLNALSCNWVILHNEMGQLQVKIQTNPTGIVLNNKNFSKNYVYPQNKFIQLQFENANFTPNFTPFQCLNQTSNKNRCFLKKDRYAFYLSYATLMTYVPVLGFDQFQFPCTVIFGDFYSNWFKLVSANPPNSQTFNQKRKLLLRSSRFFG